ncbi:MAG: hypothetical protein NZM40_04870 [Sphingomonadaceae bacterium]|uniref:hypothetical protein n=1 Tax=Thermaurantiacus sp. TaxID=2820283 RepID=UPI00298EEA35|nr:hypothetical protein [Thermaurantiacus sp.]MCS6986751.1 hypothetical protein [Sphingomonadaceae bacterium]MDW8413986.1 hypothetical protein [Thermaurantiacus sp.]
MPRFLVATVALAVAACAPSLLYERGDSRIAVPGEVPRDSLGNPVWEAIRPPPPGWDEGRQPVPPPPASPTAGPEG